MKILIGCEAAPIIYLSAAAAARDWSAGISLHASPTSRSFVREHNLQVTVASGVPEVRQG